MIQLQNSLRHCSRIVPFGLCIAVFAWTGEVSVEAEETAEQAGYRIAQEAREKQKGFGNFTADLKMVLRNKEGRESEREVSLKVLEMDGDGDRTLFVFDRPRDVKGTAFLVHAHIDEPDDQWLFLPALNRVKRISSSKQSGSFMGSEFSYEDLGAVEVEKFTHRLIRNEECGELDCTVSERIPMDPDSGYSRQLVWTDTDELRTVQVQYFNRGGQHLKTLVVDGFNKYLERFWRPTNLTMTNHLTGKSTSLNWSNYQFATDLDENDFTQTALRRAR